ncbi:unnamed protein product [Rodentolepis nana]|uniref:Uncharacterized protein n=1 Tax=Rodentolepis nana TaxID=102285 RepID=A0A0R3TNH1_RODNA|nr:unnamed protein product [Rodentolepis nana]
MPTGGRIINQLPSTISQDLLSASTGGVTNGEDNQNSTSSTTNGGGGGVNGASDTLGKSPSVVAMVTANSPSALGTSPMMNFYDAAAGNSIGGMNTYMTHHGQQNIQPPPRNGAKLSTVNGIAPTHSLGRNFWRCSWQYWVILICVLAFLLAVSFAVFFSGVL